MKTINYYPESLNADQLEILKLQNEKEAKKDKVFRFIIGGIIFLTMDALIAFAIYILAYHWN